MSISALIVLIYVLVLASYLGFELISKVPPTLHTPLIGPISPLTAVSGSKPEATDLPCGPVGPFFISRTPYV